MMLLRTALLPTVVMAVDSSFTLGVTGDVNLNPNLPRHTPPEFVWGDLLDTTRSVGLMAIQHEGTLAEKNDPNPQTIQFEDPLNYTATYAAAGIDFIDIANNHQFDFGWDGLARTQATLAQTGIAFGGVGRSAAEVRAPVVIPAMRGRNTVDVAFFSVVIDECWKWPNGSLYLDGCTCGASANPTHLPPYQCYAANGTLPAGLWYRFNITEDFIDEVAHTVAAYKAAQPTTLVVCYLHVGPNFQWEPYPEHEQLLRNISMGADLVWATSSHHIQRFEVYRGTPIIYGLGDFLFRHVVGVEDWCPIYAVPCADYRPDLSLMYIFQIHANDAANGIPRIDLRNISAVGTRHDHSRTNTATAADDVAWIMAAFGRQAVGASLVPSPKQPGWYRVRLGTLEEEAEGRGDADGVPQSAVAASPLFDALRSLPFSNEGVSRAGTNTTEIEVSNIYLEQEAPLWSQWAWSDGRITPFHTHSYLFEANATATTATPGVVRDGWAVPQTGIRSAPPLGGLSTGAVELRGDGTLRAWTIENASPAGAAKLNVLDQSIMAIKIGGADAKAIRTNPPAGVAGVGAIKFSGLAPYTRLTPQDAAFPTSLGIEIYGRSSWKVGDMAGSAVPAVGFTLALANPTKAAVDVSFLLSSDLQLQSGTQRCEGTRLCPATTASTASIFPAARVPTATSCHAACQQNASCLSWTWFNGTRCDLRGDAPLARNAPESVPSVSGVKGGWLTSRSAKGCLTLTRPGSHPSAGSASLCASSDTAVHAVSHATASSLDALFAEFHRAGSLSGLAVSALDPLAASSITATVPARSNATLTISLGWRFPHKDFMGTTVGNHYATLVASSEAAAGLVHDDGAAVAVVDHWAQFAKTLLGRGSSVPTWLGDTLINSLHHTRSAMWLGDGRWRQWESFSCVNVDSVHNDGERHIPYSIIFPGGLKSKMQAWAAGQGDDERGARGMINEQLACGCMDAVPAKLDTPCGRVMGDVSSMFIVYLLEMYQWMNDTAAVRELWPVAKEAARWQINRSATHGLPDHLVDTYDGLQLSRYNVSMFSGMFHLLAMRAASTLARTAVVKDVAFAQECDSALMTGRRAMDLLLWNETAGYYRAYTGGHATMTDATYAQVLAHTLGLGTLTTVTQMKRHLLHVRRTNDSPVGLLVQTGRYRQPDGNRDDTVWMMGSSNWATLSLWHDAVPTVDEALAPAKKQLEWVRDCLHDMWNTVAVYSGTGYGNEDFQPLANSHYGYHMVAWHLLFALSGQFYNRPAGKLALAPKLVARPFELPVLVPSTAASIACDAAGICTLSVVAGAPLSLRALAVHRVPAPVPAEGLTLKTGQSVSWQVY